LVGLELEPRSLWAMKSKLASFLNVEREQ
jgi:hypothetical protein